MGAPGTEGNRDNLPQIGLRQFLAVHVVTERLVGNYRCSSLGPNISTNIDSRGARRAGRARYSAGLAHTWQAVRRGECIPMPTRLLYDAPGVEIWPLASLARLAPRATPS